MTTTRATTAAGEWSVTTARRMMLVLTVVLLLPSTAYSILGYSRSLGGLTHPAVVLPLVALIGALHVRHALAAGGGRRPAGWPLTFAVLVLAACVPLTWLGPNWASLQSFVIASALMLLRGRVALAAAGVPVVATYVGILFGETLVHWKIVLPIAWALGLVFGGLSLYGSARAVRIAEQLEAARAELAAAAVGRERLRLSRDLHDVLGQSLSAVSLKGDLALALLRRDPAAARAEIVSLTAVADDARQAMQAVTRAEHTVSFAAELATAVALLRDAGISTTTGVDRAELAPAVDRLLAWAVREGATNVLRHSRARTCSIDCRGDGPTVRLTITNDGAGEPGATGTGLAGLASRARELGGTTSGSHTGDTFRLVLEAPAAPGDGRAR
ncbi:sensor histidine kinase [Pseudonocardia zijingensis]|uniref:Histidine kinase n=1 Tax=Pseudonocardia zijingensis TaxID=153376 RepID=A0ABN1QW73_9PSEU